MPHLESVRKPGFLNPFELFRPSIQAIWLNIRTLVAVTLTAFATILVPALLISAATGVRYRAGDTGDSPFLIVLAIVIGFVALVAAIVLFSAFVPVGLKSVRGKQVSFNEAVNLGKRYAWRLLLLGLASGVLIILGFILFIIPGLFMLRRYYLAPYFLVDHNLGVFEAMRQSTAASKKFSGPIWGLIGVNLLLGILGIIPIIGLLASIPQLLYSFAPAKRYDELQKAVGHHKAQAHKVTA
jgi:hypothetical protein